MVCYSQKHSNQKEVLMTIIIKRDGRKEELDLDKIHAVVGWSCEDITGVSISEVEMKSQIQFYDDMTSADIHETLIRSASELISEETPNYQYVASKLINFDLRKRAYLDHEPWPIKDIVARGVERGFYNPDLMTDYDDNDWAFMEGVINHARDFDISYAGMVQFRTKYLVKNKSTMEYFETPQVAYMLIAASGCIMEDKKKRLKLIKQIYNHLSRFDFTLPTPIMAGLRTNVKQFSSCTLIDVGDSLDSINAAASAVVKYAANKAGIGLNVGRIRGVGSPIRNGEVTHTGIIPFIKYFNAALKSCNQGGVRNSSGTFYYPMWHFEYEDLIVLKNNKGTEDTRVRSVDYGVQLNRFLIQRLIDDGQITLFSPADVPDLYEAFYTDQPLFAELYVKYEKDDSIRKKTMTALEAFSILAQERVETGRIYIQFVDNTNEQGMLGEENPVYMSNLCLVGDTKIDVICDDQPFKIDIQDVGDFMRKYDNVIVKSYNTDTKAVEYMPIEAFGLTNPDADLYEVTTDDGKQSVVCTSDHLFWTDNRGYVAAIDLIETDELKTL